MPATLDWDLWLGIADTRAAVQPTSTAPFNWRGFYDFGCGSLGDMACHILGAPNWRCSWARRPASSAFKQEGKSNFMLPDEIGDPLRFPGARPHAAGEDLLVRRHEGAARDSGVPKGEILGDLPRAACRRPGQRPGRSAARFADHRTGVRVVVFERLAASRARIAPERARHATPKRGSTRGSIALASPGSNGSLFVGDKGLITTGTYGEDTRLLPVEKMRDYKFPHGVLTRSPGHYHDWIRACKGGDPACSNFSVAAPFTEWILLGVIALRVEGKLEWDSEKMRITNNAEANKFIKPTFRKGWSLS